ncbi:SDR family NAD(P)-dependent oxidoreductase [Virgibacillus profundi]|nr:SDR family oxidoreductase [Virgibacillus profundi]
MLQLDLRDKVVFVFDGEHAVGEEIIKLFSEAGAKVLFLGKSNLDEDSLVLKYKEDASSFEVGSFNLKDNSFLKVIQDQIQVDIIINNMEAMTGKDVMDISPEEWENGLFTNLHIPFQLLKMILPLMKNQEEGAVINISSTSAIDGGDGDVLYAASKSALESMNKALSRELGPYNIRVNGLSVGSIPNDKDVESDLHSIPLNRFATPTDIANAALFLSTPMAGYISGQTILVDGGKTLL